MVEEPFRIGDFELDTRFTVSPCSFFVREKRGMVDGNAKKFLVSGPRELSIEIHYIELENNDRWLMVGEAFVGPSWFFSQTKDRLRMNVIPKPEGFVFDLTLPTPGKKNKEYYTSSRASTEELSNLYTNLFIILHEFGAKKIGTREENIGDTSSRRNYLNVVLDDPDCLAPVIAYFITRVISLFSEYEKLLSQNLVNEDLTQHYPKNTSSSNDKEDDIQSMVEGGESHNVEFKPAIWFNKGRSDNDPDYVTNKNTSTVKDNIIKTVAGFLNAEGGTLLIGVSDDGKESYGIEMDVSLTSRGDVDGYELELNQLLMRSINKEVVAMKVRISFPLFKSKKICRVDVMKSYEAVFADTTKNKEIFFVRIGNSTNRLSPSSMVSYVQNHEWAELEE